MLRRDLLRFLAAGSAVSVVGCARSATTPSVALPEDVRPYRLPRAPAPALLPHPPGTFPLAPRAPRFPYFDDRAAVIRDARGISDALERYIRAWFDGRVPADIPRALLPKGMNDVDFPSARLVRAEDIDVQRQWSIRPARPIDPAGYLGFFPDPNVTYLVIPAMYLPFGSKVVVEGEFPYARFFDLQVTPSFEPELYRYDGGVGVAEVPLVDADIEPLPGHVNPFRVGADRRDARRGYRIELEMAVGDPVALNAAFRPPYFRAPGNRRVGAGLQYQGAWGAPWSNGHRRGLWDTGQLWLRYYAPDDTEDPHAGVALPRVRYELPDGRGFFVEFDIDSFNRRANRVVAIADEPPMEPIAKMKQGPGDGWFKQTGIFRGVIGGIALGTGWGGAQFVRDLDRGVAGRGSELPAPSDYEQSATSATYVDYLVRGMCLGANKVVALTGRLPTIPATRNGAPRMTAAQARYWSLVGYAVPSGWDFVKALDRNAVIGSAVHAVMDEELVLDGERRYVIVLSRPADRPRNATAANGVTWVDWGPSAHISWTLRWLTVGPEWTDPRAPTPQRLGRKADLWDPGFDVAAISRNDHGGLLGDLLPRVHYLDAAAFEALGSEVTAESLPVWR
jgi:hypothetical protein